MSKPSAWPASPPGAAAIVMFDGKYHGHFDEVLVKRAGRRARPSLLGTAA